ncbi:helix-turn-helix domain-containing protein [Paludibacterium denitrificans]|uniref:helix-turn-helix domain-containing protein n=1 Tax=Paludibacterium denitrificans TaxID=2675226 RepID=UPI001E3323C3|nr:helix-turn-helix domain-containing protein [Paludibacterium denitrificans]
MEKQSATQIFESLSSPIRLDIYRLLVKCGLEGMVAGQIASTWRYRPITCRSISKACCMPG